MDKNASGVKFTKQSLDYIKEMIANPSHRFYHNPLRRFVAKKGGGFKLEPFLNDNNIADKFFAWSDQIKSLDVVKLPQRVKNLIKPRKRAKEHSYSAFKTIEEKVKKNLHSIDMKVSEGEKLAIAQRRERALLEAHTDRSPIKMQPVLGFGHSEHQFLQPPQRKFSLQKGGIRKSSSLDHVTGTPTSQRGTISLKKQLEKEFFDDKINHGDLISTLKKTKDNPAIHEIQLTKHKSKHLIRSTERKASLYSSTESLHPMENAVELPSIKDSNHLKVNGVIYFRTRNAPQHKKTQSLPNLWQSRMTQHVTEMTELSTNLAERSRVRNILRCPQRGSDYLKSLDQDYLKDLNDTVNDTIEEMKMKKRAKVDYGARRLKNVKEETERAFTPSKEQNAKTLAMKALYQISSGNRKDRQMLTRHQLLMKNEELKDEARKEAMQAKIDAWAHEKRELNAMMQRFGESERRISTLAQVKEKIIEDLGAFLKQHRINWRDFFHPNNLPKHLEFIRSIQKDEDYQRFVETNKKTLWELISEMVEVVCSGLTEDEEQKVEEEELNLPSSRFEVSPQAEEQFRRVERNIQSLSAKYRQPVLKQRLFM